MSGGHLRFDRPDPLRVKACSICGTDLRIVRGEKTKGVRIPCGTCRACCKGFASVCENRTAIGSEYDGGFQQMLKIPSTLIASENVFKLPPSISFAEASLLEPLSCCIHGRKKMPVRADESVLVFGAGPIGLMHVMLLKAKRIGRIIVCDRNPDRLRMANELGADDAVNSLDKVETCDHVICAVGVGHAIPELVARLRRGGTLLLFAGLPKDVGVEVDLNQVHYHELAMIGSSASTRNDFRDALEMCRGGRIPLSRLITHRVPLGQIAEAFELAGSGRTLKVVVEP